MFVFLPVLPNLLLVLVECSDSSFHRRWKRERRNTLWRIFFYRPGRIFLPYLVRIWWWWWLPLS
jgi:hypothetical protein